MQVVRGAVWLAYAGRHFTKGGFQRRQKAEDWREEDVTEQAAEASRKRVVVVTGANSGLGRAATKAFAALGHEVHMLCRNAERGANARDELAEDTKSDSLFLHVVDVSKAESIASFCSSFTAEHERLDVLVNNAGVLLNERQETDDGLEATFATNTLGTYRLTEALLPLLSKSGTAEEPARVVVVSSGGLLSEKMDLSDLTFKKGYSGPPVYAQTKRHQLYMTEKWAQQHKDDHVRFYCMHPGWADTPGVATSLPSFHNYLNSTLRTSEEGADTIVWLSLCMRDELLQHNGDFYLDRAIERTSLPLTATESSEEEKAELMQMLEKYRLE